MELIRKILITLEYSNQTQGWIPLKFDWYSDDEISYHVKILAEQADWVKWEISILVEE